MLHIMLLLLLLLLLLLASSGASKEADFAWLPQEGCCCALPELMENRRPRALLL
jgi:hypothetical protein